MKKKQKSKKKHARKRRSIEGTRQKSEPVSPIKQKLDEINRLKPIIERAKEISKLERVKDMQNLRREVQG